MMRQDNIEEAIRYLKANLKHVGRVYEWADLMGYQNPKNFSEKFLQHYGVRPQKIMELIRLESIIKDLRGASRYSNKRIAHKHSLPDGKTLNNFTNYHAGHSPTALKRMPEQQVSELIVTLWDETLEEAGKDTKRTGELSLW